MPERYAPLFERLRAAGEGAFVPFSVLGDPDPATSLEIVRTLVEAGADALELGLPFSDPVADGPTIQAADVRALAAGTRLQHAWALIRALRDEFPALPIGLLVYANLVERHGAPAFYATAAAAGVDSVLVADLPTLEAPPYVAAALAAGISPVLIATPSCSDTTLSEIARLGAAYTYVVARSGVTGADMTAPALDGRLLERLAAVQAAPALLGFGIAHPEHVRTALALGAAGAISGSAIVQRIERHLDAPSEMLRVLAAFVREMKAATRQAG
ncbi:MAG: tryptophan synthase subunit alpha [Proteobacteria bacterium]|nr:tryptophan synthase subunit alpha [Pseudomonadota bacterium]